MFFKLIFVSSFLQQVDVWNVPKRFLFDVKLTLKYWTNLLKSLERTLQTTVFRFS